VSASHESNRVRERGATNLRRSAGGKRGDNQQYGSPCYSNICDSSCAVFERFLSYLARFRKAIGVAKAHVHTIDERPAKHRRQPVKRGGELARRVTRPAFQSLGAFVCLRSDRTGCRRSDIRSRKQQLGMKLARELCSACA